MRKVKIVLLGVLQKKIKRQLGPIKATMFQNSVKGRKF